MAQPLEDAAIKSIKTLSTGWGEQHREHRHGSLLPQIWWVLTSRSWIRIPLHCFAIEHRDGLILFDTGMDPAIKLDPGYIDSAVGRFLLRRIFRLHIGPEDALGRQLEKHGHAAAAVAKVIVSHLHFDHIGGISDVPQAELLVSQDEWAQLSLPHPERKWILRDHIELPGAKWRQIAFKPVKDPLFEAFDGIFDVMGDGSLVALPTPGHTAGSLSLLVRSAGMKPLLLIGDLAYDTEMLMRGQTPGTGDAATLRASYAKVRALKEKIPDLVILASHDQGVADKVRKASRQGP